jgi:hypothetical protein
VGLEHHAEGCGQLVEVTVVDATVVELARELPQERDPIPVGR